MSQYTRVVFTVYAEANIGDCVRLTGDVWSMGGFRPSRGVELVTTPDTYPMWRTPKPVLIPMGRAVEYKYLVQNFNNKKATYTWEPIQAHSRTLVTKGEDMQVDDVFGVYDEPADDESQSLDTEFRGQSTDHSPAAELEQSDSFRVRRAMSASVGSVERRTASSGIPIFAHGTGAGTTRSGASTSVLSSSPLEFGNVDSLNTNLPSEGSDTEHMKNIHADSKLNRSRSLQDRVGIVRRQVKKGNKIQEPALAFSGTVDPGRKKSPKKQLLLVSFHLPIKVIWNKNKLGNSESGFWTVEWDHDNLVSKSENSVADDHHVKWIGAVTRLYNCHKSIWELSGAEKEEIKKVIMANDTQDCIPLFISKDLYQDYYVQCCKKRLRNVFHNVLHLPDNDETDKQYMKYAGIFDRMVEGNRVFCDAVFDTLDTNPNAKHFVWVHDYHLLLLPQLLREESDKRQQAFEGNSIGGSNSKNGTGSNAFNFKVVYFLHIPFPTSEVFRTLSVRDQLLRGMLGADIVGFHTFDHARHFLTCCKRFLGLQYHSRKGGTLMIDYRGRPMLLAVSHVGIEPRLLNNMIKSIQVKQMASRLKDATRGKKVIASVDELQRLKGVPYKLLAFERLLDECPRWRNNVIFVQHGLRRSANDQSWFEEKGDVSAIEIKQLVDRINSKHGPVVKYKEHDGTEPSLEERVALWMAVDVMVSTPSMEGLNLFPLEYVYCHRPAGVVIVSEFSACSRILNGAMRVNCFDIEAVSNAYDQALCMSITEREARRERDFEYISNSPSSTWTRNILAELHSSERVEDETFTVIDSDEAHGADTVTSMRHVLYKGTCQPFDSSAILEAYNSSKKRVILLDFGGTISQRERSNISLKRDFLGVSKRKLDPNLLSILKNLCGNKKNIVFIVSGNTTKVLMTAFKDILSDPDTPLGLVAHSGLSIRWGGISANPRIRGGHENISLVDNDDCDNTSNMYKSPSTVELIMQQKSSQGWEFALPGISKEWGQWMIAADVGTILEDYTWRTGGSSWSRSPVTTTWDFRQSDPEWGGIQAKSLEEELTAALQRVNVPVEVLRKRNTVQLLPRGVSKGTAVEKILKKIPEVLKRKDPTDENTQPDFTLCIGDDIADELMFSAALDHGRRNVFTCTVGRKPTEAQYYLNDTKEVLGLLKMLAHTEE